MESVIDEPDVVLNKAEFNEAFLAYDKRLMYGADVLSCLNKAQNNNQRYVYNNYYGTDTETIGSAARTEYFIDVEVKLKSYLKEELNVYYRNSSGMSVRIPSLEAAPVKSNFTDQLFMGGVNQFKMPNVIYYYFQNGNLYKENISYADAMWTGAAMNKNKTIQQILSNSDVLQTSFGNDTTYHLLSGSGIEDNSSVASRKQSAKLSALLSTVTLMEQNILNSPMPTSFNDSDWYSATWKTAAYDFKTRKFRCTNVEYNNDTGYINKISFEEIDT